MRRKVVAGNWKMHGSRAANKALIEAVLAGLGEGDASCQGHGPHPSRVGVRAYRAVPCERAGDPGLLEGVCEVAR